MDNNVFSLSSVVLTINNPNRGLITIGGGGKLVGSIGYSFKDSMFTQETTADGGAVVSFNKSKAGSVTVDITQTSPIIKDLVDYLLWCREHPELAFADIECRDATGNLEFSATGVTPVSIPGNTVGSTATSRSFTFNAVEINPKV